MKESGRFRLPLAVGLIVALAASLLLVWGGRSDSAAGGTTQDSASAPGHRSAAAPAPSADAPLGLALIIAIDEYLQPDIGLQPLLRLDGAVNDAVRVRELLRGRFGFAEQDIVSLIGAEATHEAIVRTFDERLIRRAGPDTRVVIWFSGHGSRVPDLARADPAPRDGDDPFDDTLVAHDSRQGDRSGSYDVTDDELHSLLAGLKAKDVVLVTDCCHSGGLLRGPDRNGGTRHAGYGTRPLDREAIKGFWPPDLPFLDDDRGDVATSVVQIAACDSMQEAGECRGADGSGMYGTLTWYLTSALAEVPADTSWQAVAELVRARVASCRTGTRPSQIVQGHGPVHRAIFGGRGAAVPQGYLVRPFGAQLIIEIGRIHGVVEDTELRLIGLDDREHGRARVVRARTSSCVADLIGGVDLPAGIALRAVPYRGLDGRAPLRVRVAALTDAALLRDCPWAVAATAEDVDYVLRPEDDHLVLETPDGVFVRDVASAAPEARQTLFHEHCFRSLWEGVARPGRFRVGLSVRAIPGDSDVLPARVHATAGEPRALVGAPPLPQEQGAGAHVMLTVTNDSEETLHIAILSLQEDREVNVIWGKDANNVLGPGAFHNLRVELGPSRRWRQQRPMVDRYVAIATPRYADFKPFESTAEILRGGEVHRGQPAFLAGALQGSATRGGGDPPPWGIHWLDLELVLPEQFEALTRER